MCIRDSTDVAQVLRHGAIEQRTDTGLVHLDADEILLGRGGGHLQGGMAHAEADLEGARRAAPEHLIEVTQAVFQFQAEQRPALVDAALLAFGHAPGAVSYTHLRHAARAGRGPCWRTFRRHRLTDSYRPVCARAGRSLSLIHI